MHVRIGFDIAFDVPAPTPILLVLRVYPDRERDLVEPEQLVFYPDLPVSEYFDIFGNRVERILAPAGELRLTNRAVVRVDDRPDRVVPNAAQHSISELPADAIQFLMGSRYCEVDRLGEIAWSFFGHTPLGWPRVQAVCDWVHQNVEFGYHHARSTKTAYDTFCELKGVCRDFTHLAITFCRCLNIPARYTTGYLGDIRVPPSDSAMDFSAWFEVYLGGKWHTFDARHNTPRIGRIPMARGRDAVDVALTTAFGPTTLKHFEVHTEEIPSP